jgi:hypothetical protein
MLDNIETTTASKEFDYSDIFLSEDGLTDTKIENYKLSSIARAFDAEDDRLMNNFSFELFDAILNNKFEFGSESAADRLFNSYHNTYGVLAVNWLVKLFVSNIFNSKIVLGIILIISRQPFTDIGYQGQMILISATYQFKEDIEIQEAIIRCVENWETFEVIEILKRMHPSEKWLEDYKLGVIQEIEKLCHTL